MVKNIQNATLKITNTLGQEMINEAKTLVAQNQFSYDVSGFAAGIYFIEVLDNNKCTTNHVFL